MKGFTLIEVVVVVGIIAILAAVIGVNVADSGMKSRDAKRQADLQTMQSAIELYKNKYGRYPAQCATSGTSAEGWSGQLGTYYECTGTNTQYIVGLAPEFIPVLPKDPKLNGPASGYAYRVNTAGTVYKLMARSTVESENVNWAHKFSSCNVISGQGASNDILSGGWCVTGISWSSNSKPPQCDETNAIFQKSYGVWGGFAPLLNPGPDPLNPLASIPDPNKNNKKYYAVSDTTTVICR